MKNDQHITLRRKAIINYTSALSLVIGSIGIGCLLNGMYELFMVENPESVGLLITGTMLSVAMIPALHRSGIELDPMNKRFREYDGTLGRNKGDWIEVEKDDYLSIVGVNSTHAGSGMGMRVSRITMGMSKVYFFSGDWHVEVYKGHYEKATKFATTFASTFNLPINDVNKDQNLKTGQDGFGNFGSFSV